MAPTETPDAVPGDIPMLADAARGAEANGDWPTALDIWSKVQTLSADRYDGYFGMAECFKHLGQAEQAAATLREAGERIPHDATPWHHLARLQEAARDWTAAEDAWRRFIAVEANIWWSYTGLASTLHEQERDDDAETVLLEAAKRFPKELSPVVDLARIADRRGAWQIALARWQAVRTAFPDQYIGYRGAVASLRQLGRTDEAMEVLKDAAVQLRTAPDPLRDLGRLCEEMGDWTGAEDAWRQVLGLGHVAPADRTALTNVLRHAGRIGEAEITLLEQLVHTPDDLAILTHFAQLAEVSGDWSQALDRWQTVKARAPGHYPAYQGVVACLRHLDRTDDAIEVLREASETLPGETGPWHDLARSPESRAGWSDAERCWRRFLGIESGVPWAHAALAHVLVRQDRNDEAEAVLAAQLDRFPHEPQIFVPYAHIAEARDDWPEAERRWRIFLSSNEETPNPYIGLAIAIRTQHRYDDAEYVLESALQRFPRDLDLAIARATTAEALQDWHEAIRRWRTVEAIIPG